MHFEQTVTNENSAATLGVGWKRRAVPWIALALGLAAVAALIAGLDYHNLAQLLRTAGPRLLWLIPLHVLPVAVDALGLYVLLRARTRGELPGLMALVGIACVREAAGTLLPVARVGGTLVSLRLLIKRGVDSAFAGAAAATEFLLHLATQYLFAVLGCAILLQHARPSGVLRELSWALFAFLPLFLLLWFGLRRGRLFSRMMRSVRALSSGKLAANGLVDRSEQMEEELRRLLSHWRLLAAASTFQMAGLLLSCTETWVAMRLLGHPIGIGQSVVLESLSQAARNVAVFVPGGLGVQEGSLVLLGRLIGLPHGLALALSVAKRIREVGFGIAPLLAWSWLEGRFAAIRPE